MIIIAVVVVLSLVVVGLVLTQVDNSQQVSSSGNQLGLSNQVIGITESMVDPDDGNFVVRLLNNSGDVITISNVRVGKVNVGFSEDLVQGGSKFFRVSSSSVCEEGAVLSEDVVITYVTMDGLVKTEKYPAKVMFNCTPYMVNANLLANQCEVCEVCSSSEFAFLEFEDPVYEDNGDGTVIDSVNGFVWQKSSYNNGSPLSWHAAKDYCANNANGSLPGSGWRVPNVIEAALVYEFSLESIGEIYPQFDSSDSLDDFWSSTTMTLNTDKAYYFDYSNGTINNDNKANDSNYGVRCVRSGS